METLIFILISYGITSIIVDGSIFYPLIEKTKGWLKDLLSCPLCTSTWIGFILGTILILLGENTPISSYINLPIALDVFACGMLSAGGVWSIENLKK